MMLVQICYIKRYVKPGTKYNEYQKVVEFLRLSSTTSFPFEPAQEKYFSLNYFSRSLNFNANDSLFSSCMLRFKPTPSMPGMAGIPPQPSNKWIIYLNYYCYKLCQIIENPMFVGKWQYCVIRIQSLDKKLCNKAFYYWKIPHCRTNKYFHWWEVKNRTWEWQ